MKAEEIRDRETLEAWLRERPRRDAVVIAHRAALRVLPVWGAAMGEGWSGAGKRLITPMLRCGLITGLASARPDIDLAKFVEVADDQGSDAWAAVAYYGPSMLTKNAPGYVKDAGQACYVSVQTVDRGHWSSSANSVAFADAAGGEEVGFSAAKKDAIAVAEGGDLLDRPMWGEDVPDAFRNAEKNWLKLWDADPPERWAFWRRWWEGAKSGQPLDPELQLAIVKGVDEETWKDPDKVAERIAEIEDAFKTERAAEDRLDEVIAATPNAERVEGNPDTGALIVVPDAGIDGALFDYAARKVAGAISIIRLDASNQYTALEADLAMLQAALEVTPGLPLELFDACASATGRLVLRCEIGDLPPLEKDPVLTDYRNRLRDAGSDLYGNDPQTQSVVAARNALAGNDVFLEHPRDVGAAVEEIGPALEGHLATALPRDAKIASDPAASAEERKPATYRLVSRTLRIAKIAGYAVGGGAATVVGTKEVLEAIPVIQASPHFQKLVEFALRWLGF